MTIDFARKLDIHSSPRRKAPSATRVQEASRNVWGWYFAGVLSGILAVSIDWLALMRQVEMQKSTEVTTAESPENTSPVFTYGFYKEFENPNAVASIQKRLDVPAATNYDVQLVDTQSSAENSSQPYLVQAGSFFNRENAESLRAQLVLLNLRSNLVQSIVKGRNIYLVQAGPYRDRRLAEAAKNILISNGIESILLLPP